MSKNWIAASAIGLLACGCATVSPPDAAQRERAAMELKLWPGEAPGFEGAKQVEKESIFPAGKFPVVRNVIVPTLAVYLPPPDMATGTGVIIAPGGGFRFLTMHAEGYDVAHWLVSHGIAAFVLKYRLTETPADDAEMWTEMSKLLTGKSDRPIRFDQDARPGIADGKRAMELVRAHAKEWGVASDRIGILGFSAGAMVASNTDLESSPEDRPNFVAPIYGAPFGDIPPVSATEPPFFLAYASDDPLVPKAVDALYAALQKAGQHPELHVYRDGGHGFGLNKQGTSSDFWIDDFYNWMKSLGLTQPKVPG